MSATPVEAIPTPPARLHWMVLPALIAVASRLFSVLLLLGQPPHLLPLLTGDPSPLVAWDGQWYLHIAQFGYHAEAIQPTSLGGHHDFAFYPGWPLLIQLASLGGLLPMGGTAVILANVVFLLAAIVVYRVLADRFNDRVAIGGVLLLSFNPAAYAFSMAYSESLFLLLAALFFVTQYRRLSPVFAFLSMLVRVSGLAIGAAAAVTLVTRREDRLIPFLSGVAVAIGFVVWWVFIWQLTGRFTGFFEGSAEWSRYLGVASILREVKHRPVSEALWLAFVAVMIGGSLLLLRRHPDLAAYSLVAIGLSLLGAPASSMPRHSMIAFPAFAALSEKLGMRLTVPLAVLFAGAEIAFVNFAFAAGVHRPP